MACVDVRALPLQLVLRRHPEWAQLPVAVVDRDSPSGLILWANGHAQAQGVYAGMRYATGLALSRTLCAEVVEDAELASYQKRIARRLWRFSPAIEPGREAGIFWLDPSGLQYLFPRLERWALEIRRDLLEADLHAVVVVGFTRFGSYAAAKSSRRNLFFRTPEEENRRVRAADIAHLPLGFEVQEHLARLGITTIGAFIALPPGGVKRRFGGEAAALHQFARGDGWAPLQPERLREPVECSVTLDYPEDNTERLLGRFANMLQGLLAELEERHEQLRSLRFALRLEDHTELQEELSPAAPTLELMQLLLLLRLRLEALQIPSPVAQLKLRAAGSSFAERQLTLAPDSAQQRLQAANEGLAKLRAHLGNHAVRRIRLRRGHLPEARHVSEPMERIELPKPGPARSRPLVRRIFTPPIELPPRPQREPDGWLVVGLADGPVEEVIGPDIIAGGWWRREITRGYYYLRTRSGRWLWVYYDYRRRRWFLHGEVE